MRNYKTFGELKSLATTQMTGKTFTLIAGLIIPSIIVLIASQLAIVMIPGFDLLSNILFYIVLFIIQLLAGVLQAGCVLLYLHAACNMPCKITDLFYCFKSAPDKAIKVQFFLTIINSICTLPSDILSWTTTTTTLDYQYLAMVSIVSLLGSVAYMLFTLGVFPVFYMMLDYPEYTVSEIYKKSWELMKGNKWRYFLLNLSFLPSILVVSLIVTVISSIAIMYNLFLIVVLAMAALVVFLYQIMAHLNLTCANFYLDMTSVKNAQPVESEASTEQF